MSDTNHAASQETSHEVPPPVKGGLVAYLTVDGAMKAAEFYARAFGAEIVASMPADEQGRTMHVHLYVNGSSLMLSDAFPEHGHPLQAPQSFSLMLTVDAIDARYAEAVAAGATALMPPPTCSGATATASCAIPSASSGG